MISARRARDRWRTRCGLGWLLALCWVAACMSTGGAETLIGAPCTTSDDCDASGVCITDGKDGLCSQECMAPGRAGACPLGSYCDRATLATDMQDTTVMILCLPACKAQSDCREGYTCGGVSDGPGKVCRPN